MEISIQYYYAATFGMYLIGVVSGMALYSLMNGDDDDGTAK